MLCIHVNNNGDYDDNNNGNINDNYNKTTTEGVGFPVFRGCAHGDSEERCYFDSRIPEVPSSIVLLSSIREIRR